MKIDIGINNLARIAVDKKLVEKVAAGVIKGEAGKLSGSQDIELSVAFVGKEKIRQINKKYRGIDCVTDVLSFAEDGRPNCVADESFPKILGEIVICAAVVKKDALEAKINYKEDLAWVVIHGILHLFGYDHEKEESEAKSMRQREKFYLSKYK